ncbi:MAG: hypothetical protein WD555_05070 [Fulvivirga sp.]
METNIISEELALGLIVAILLVPAVIGLWYIVKDASRVLKDH